MNADGHKQFGTNISAGGAFLRTSMLAPMGTVLGLEFFEPGQGRTLMIKGRVVTVIDQPAAAEVPAVTGMGVKFEDMGGDDYRRMSAIIEAFELAAPGGKESAMRAGIKRRRNRRVNSKDMTAHLRIKGEVVALSVPVSNLSLGGLFLDFADPLAVGTEIDVELRAAGQLMVIFGDVVGVLSPEAATQRGIAAGLSMRFKAMTRRTAERLRSALMTLAPLAADGLRHEALAQRHLPEPSVELPSPNKLAPPAASRGEFNFDAGYLSEGATDEGEGEDLRSELERLKAEVQTRHERIAAIEKALRDDP